MRLSVLFALVLAAGIKSDPKFDAKVGVHYTAVAGTLTWEDGDATPRVITISILHPAGDPPTGKRFSLTFSGLTGEAKLAQDIWPISVIPHNAGQTNWTR